MTTKKQELQRVKKSDLSSSSNGSPFISQDEDMSRSALAMIGAKEEEIGRKKMEVRERVQVQLGRAEAASKRLAEIHAELEGLTDPVTKEVLAVRKKIDMVDLELKSLGQSCLKKEKEYKESLEAFNEKSKEKAQLVSKFNELDSESERQRMKKLEELSKHVESLG